MPLFKLDIENGDLSKARLVEATRTEIDLERHLECWLEGSPGAVVGEQVLVIARQATAAVDGGVVYPDLLALDSQGNLVIMELKKGRSPREIVAQILEYAAWASDLSEEEVRELADAGLARAGNPADCGFTQVFSETFEADEVPPLNQRLRLFLVAEDWPPTVPRVCRFLRTRHGLDVSCVTVAAYRTTAGEILVSTTPVVGQEEVLPPKHTERTRWSGDKPVKQVVWEGAREVTGGRKDYVFSPKQVADAVLRRYPGFNRGTIGCQIIADAVNHTSRHHYPGGEDRYWWLGSGKYRLYDSETDGVGRGA